MFAEKVKRSEFIANISPCHSEKEARAFIARVSSQHRDATHNCRAFVLADGTEYSSDDGEPSGTAGKPILNAIKRAGLVNAVVVVTRYFGGVKLGVRGLIDAYGGVTEKALALAGRNERVKTESLAVSMEYPAMGTVTRLLEGAGAENIVWVYGEGVRVTCEVPVSSCEYIARELEEMKGRGIIAEWAVIHE